jgi:hypothetical protein
VSFHEVLPILPPRIESKQQLVISRWGNPSQAKFERRIVEDIRHVPITGSSGLIGSEAVASFDEKG